EEDRCGLLAPLYPFFFQAEDGIRAFHVTGVQTCALPIWVDRQREHLPGSALRVGKIALLVAEPCEARLHVQGQRIVDLGADRPRSEERRVGKECRPPWPEWQRPKSASRRRRPWAGSRQTR